MTQATPIFPFTALVGQTELQHALLLAAVDPGIGGVLIAGPRGTAKSTAARALAALLPGAPFVTLPLAASLEQLVGTLSLPEVLRSGELRFAPGLLARAHGGVLYVDEVNLLPDALVDALLDAAASGVNIVERDGISHRHAARFVLIGTMNPEEGELRPQLLDRFGLSLQLANPADVATRQAIVRTRLDFDADAAALLAAHEGELVRLGARLAAARTRLEQLAWSDAVLARAAELALAAGVDGLRADLVMLRAARARAALEGRESVQPGDVAAVAELALAHRRTSPRTPAADYNADAGSTAPPAHAPGPAAESPSGGTPAPAPAPASAPALALAGLQPPMPAAAAAAAGPAAGMPASSPEIDWGALPPQPAGMVRVVNTGGLTPKKA